MSVESMSIRNWDISTIGTDAKIKGRIGWKGYKTSDLRDSGPVVLGGNNIRNSRYLDLDVIKHLSREKYDESPEIQLKKSDILLVTRGNGIGDVSFFNGEIDEATINPSMVIISEFQGIPEFLFYYLISKLGKDNVLSVSSGSSIPAIYQNQLAKVEYVKPPIPEQKAIAATLSVLDDTIELNNQINKKLEEMAQAIFNSWFVDFEPFKDGEFEESELGLIPKGWSTGVLGDIADNIKNGVASDDIPNNVAYIGLEHMPRKCLSLSNWEESPELMSNKFAFNEGDILYGKFRPYFHKVGFSIISGICSTDILVINLKKFEWYSFVLLHLFSDVFIDYTNAVSTGTKMPRTNWADMAKYQIVLPSSEIIYQFEKLIKPLLSQMKKNIMENRLLLSIRDTLIPKLMSGEIRVPVEEVEQLVRKS